MSETDVRALGAQLGALLKARGLWIEPPLTHRETLALLRTAPPAGWSSQDAVAFINGYGVAAFQAIAATGRAA